jgi:hypothetical protein
MDRGGKAARVGARWRWVFVALLGAPCSLVWLSASSGCQEDEGLEVRRGFAGDSCTRTDDCEVPLRCRENECVAPPPTGNLDAGVLPDGFPPGPGPSADEGPWSQCDECLENECGVAEKACGDECHAIEGCIESTCVHLSETGSPDEGACFVYCQDRFPGGKAQHIAVVECAIEHQCSPPCTFYPQDYDICRTFMNNGDCHGYRAYCESNVNCTTYRDCISLCSSIDDCLACDDTSEGIAGRQILEAYEACVAAECLTESWIP